MALFDSRAVATVLVGLLVILAFAVAAEAYVQWSSDVAFEEILASKTLATSDAEKPDIKGKTGCPIGKKELPKQLILLR